MPYSNGCTADDSTQSQVAPVRAVGVSRRQLHFRVSRANRNVNDDYNLAGNRELHITHDGQI
jgi:hemin uptake protein HemP